MTAEEFKQVLVDRNMSLSEASHYFDRSQSAIRAYMIGDLPVPRTIIDKINGPPTPEYESLTKEELIKTCRGYKKEIELIYGQLSKARAKIKDLRRAALSDSGHEAELGEHSNDPMLIAWVKKRQEATAALSEAKLGSVTERQMRETLLEYERLIAARLKRLTPAAKAPAKEALAKPGKKKAVASPAKKAYKDLF